jgi:hypothetical protein
VAEALRSVQRVTATGRVAAVLVAAALMAAGCRDGPDPTGVPADAVIVAVVRAVAGTAPQTTVPGPLPVVYVVSVAEDGVSAGVQAAVASALRDQVDVRFADRREEAVDDAASGEPVVDGGVLLVVDEIPESDGVADVAVEIYRNAADDTKWVFSLRAADEDQWAVTATSVVSLYEG